MFTRVRTSLRNLPQWQRTLWIVFFAQLCSAIGFSIIFPFLALYVEDLGTNTNISLEFWAGMVFSSQAITMMFASPFWGAIADRYGRKLMVERASFGGAIMIAWMAFAGSAEELVLIRTLQGLITGTVSATNALVASSAPRERTGYAMGVLQVGLWSGVAVGPLIGGVLADAFGYRIPFLITAFLLFIAGVMVHYGIQETISPEARVSAKKVSMIAGMRKVVTMEGVLQTFTIRFLSGLSRSMVVPIMPLFMVMLLTHGLSETALLPVPPMFADIFKHASGVNTYTGLVVGVASATATASAVYLGRLGDRIGHRNIVIGSSIVAAVLFLPQAFVTEPWQLLVLQALTGLASGGLVAAASALLARYTDPGEEGAVYGLDNSVVAAGRAIAPLVGATIAIWFGMRFTFGIMSLVFVLILLTAIFLLPRKDRVQMMQEKNALQPRPAAGD